MAIICRFCDRDIEAIGQDNMSCDPNLAECEDCAGMTSTFNDDEF